jgi:spore maturation protein CgeB
VSDWWEGLDHFFEPNREILLAHTSEDTWQALGLPDDELGRIAKRARERTLDEHSLARRAEQLENLLSHAPSKEFSPPVIGSNTLAVRS